MWINLELVLQSDVSQRKTSHINTCIQNLMNLFAEGIGGTDMKNGLVDTGRRRRR